jgi:hypothetical protein
MRKVVVALAAAAAFAFGPGSASAAPPHLHCLETASGGTHPIAQGVTNNAPHDTAFHNFHSNVHQGAFADHPLTLTADLEAPFACP